MTNPVATHTGIGAESWRQYWFDKHHSYAAYLVTAVGSYGSSSGNSYTSDSSDRNKETTAANNYAYIYNPYDANGEIDAWDNDYKLKLDSMTDAAAELLSQSTGIELRKIALEIDKLTKGVEGNTITEKDVPLHSHFP